MLDTIKCRESFILCNCVMIKELERLIVLIIRLCCVWNCKRTKKRSEQHVNLSVHNVNKQYIYNSVLFDRRKKIYFVIKRQGLLAEIFSHHLKRT